MQFRFYKFIQETKTTAIYTSQTHTSSSLVGRKTFWFCFWISRKWHQSNHSHTFSVSEFVFYSFSVRLSRRSMLWKVNSQIQMDFNFSNREFWIHRAFILLHGFYSFLFTNISVEWPNMDEKKSSNLVQNDRNIVINCKIIVLWMSFEICIKDHRFCWSVLFCTFTP